MSPRSPSTAYVTGSRTVIEFEVTRKIVNGKEGSAEEEHWEDEEAGNQLKTFHALHVASNDQAYAHQCGGKNEHEREGEC